ncbi:MAG: heme ABC exporter ATP-binding protein CcmA [Alphaproteobacteria bacterium]|nr:heme ABC exporter ATP-binding protein CcmA [Alphaproteobacteria bacterium]
MLVGQDLGCVRGERLVFGGLDLSVGPGAALVLTGPNGSGKSSLLRLLAGLLAPARGRIAWDGVPVADDPEAHRARLVFVGHHDPVKPGLTVAENLKFWMTMRDGIGDIGPALAALGLDRLADQPGRYLSAGQRRRLNLARLAAVPARLWLLDEPTAGLDSAAQAMLAALMDRHLAGGGLIVASAHGPIGLGRAATLELVR